MRKIITVDGPAGSGKSTIAKLLANLIGYLYLDTGALYRTVGLDLVRKNISPKDTKKILEALSQVKIQMDKENILLNGENVMDHIRGEEITKQTAIIAQNSDIRQFVRGLQKRIVENRSYIVNGRDVGTVVFPDAFCKFYLDASPEVRAERRLKDQKIKQPEQNLEAIKEQIVQRDESDKNRSISPLRIPVDALVIDSSKLKIDEVMERMVAYYNKRNGKLSRDHGVNDLIDSKIFIKAVENFDTHQYAFGSLIRGVIINIKPKEIVLDLGSKRDGIIPQEEMEKLDVSSLNVGQEIDVYVLASSSATPHILVSKLEADKRSTYIQLQRMHEQKEPVEGAVTRTVKGGLIVNLMGISGFCPISEYDIKRFNKDTQEGTKSHFYIIEMDTDKLVVSRKRFLEEKYERIQKKFFDEIREGDILEGVVSSITRFGVFVDIKEGVTGIIRPKDVSWKWATHPHELLKKGENIRVKVISVDPKRHRLQLSKRDLEEDPMIRFEREHVVGDVLLGKIKGTLKFGAFVEVAEGIEGLLHVSRLSWERHIENPSEIFKPDDQVEAKILSIDVAKRKVSLGLNHSTQDPWNTIEQSYPKGEILRCVVKRIVNNGIHCTVDDRFDGFIHISDMSWTQEKIKLKQFFQQDESIEAKVIGHDKVKRIIKLGMKQKTTNPWENICANYTEGSSIYAPVTRITSNGAFVKVGDELEGFCHISQLAASKVEKVEEEVEVGKEYHFAIQSIDEKDKKITLSIKEYFLNEEKKNIEKYLTVKEETKMSLGDFMKK